MVPSSNPSRSQMWRLSGAHTCVLCPLGDGGGVGSCGHHQNNRTLPSPPVLLLLLLLLLLVVVVVVSGACMNAALQAWRDGEVDVPVGGPTGEGPAAVAIRMRASVLDVLKFAPPGSMVVLVTHAHAIKALLADLLPGQGLSKIHSIPQANCGVNVIDVTAGGGFQVRAVNLICSDADEDAAPTAPTAPTAPAPPSSGGGKL